MGTNLPRITLAVTHEQLAWLNDQTAPLRNKSVVVRDLIDSAMKGVDTFVTLTERAPASAGEGGGSVVSTSTSIKKVSNRSNKKKKDAYASKNLPESIQVPDAIVDCDQLLREYWAAKKGTRSESVWNRICNKLAAWTPSDRRKALEAAINSGWADVYEPKPDRSSTASTSTLDYDAMDKMKFPW